MNAKKTRVGFAGLGQMGKHMARNLLGPDVALTVCDLKQDLFDSFRRDGAEASSNPGDLAGSDIIFLSLPGDSAVKSVLLGDGGLLALVEKGRIVVDLSTISYSLTKEIAAACGGRGVDFLDAPVSGMESRAKDGTLSVMVGGKAATLDKVRPFLERLGNKILHVGDTGCGQLTKLINQLLFDINVAALAEILPMAVKLGLDPVKTGEIVNSGTGRSYASEFFIPRILANNFSEGYPMRHAYKDLVSAALVSSTECIPLPVLQAATSTYQKALLEGYGGEDKGAMVKVFENLLGVKYRK
ncbi:MAG: NAD(P)-dependent oxidoreductase [Desulfovibrio sp.]|jgi:3-hydroxyisobutyrate dehydrogenase-like beta-hydroxyacid dehydrogenase|nr:NAD(P)-dependent oxidoreductase [Desulfovibrio sp.]